jgi:hypothetical protein
MPLTLRQKRETRDPMTEAQFSVLMKVAEAKKASDGWLAMPEGRHLTLHVASSGSTLSIGRVEKVKLADGVLQARTTRDEVYVVGLEDVFAGAAEAPQKGSRKAGFVQGA